MAGKARIKSFTGVNPAGLHKDFPRSHQSIILQFLKGFEKVLRAQQFRGVYHLPHLLSPISEGQVERGSSPSFYIVWERGAHRDREEDRFLALLPSS